MAEATKKRKTTTELKNASKRQKDEPGVNLKGALAIKKLMDDPARAGLWKIGEDLAHRKDVAMDSECGEDEKSDSDDDDKDTERLLKNVHSNVAKAKHEPTKGHTLKVDCEEFKFDATVEAWDDDVTHRALKCAAPSPFGDVANQVNVVDKAVRDGCEFKKDQFTVSVSFVADMQQAWAKHMLPENVRVEPYKIALYGKGGHFKTHTDTPEKGLVGTLLYELSSCGHVNLVLDDPKGQQTWDDADQFPICMFYPDVPHKVESKQSDWCECHRAVLAFKVFAENPDDAPPAARHSRLVSVLKDKLEDLIDEEKTVAFKLSFSYELDAQAFKGIDLLLYRALRSLKPREMKAFSCISTAAAEIDENDKATVTKCSLYLLRDEDVSAYVAGKALPPKPVIFDKELQVRSLDGYLEGQQVESSSSPFIEHTGNESRSGDRRSIYLMRILVARF